MNGGRALGCGSVRACSRSDGQPPYPYVDDELRKVARDAYVSWQGSRYSVPWQYAGQTVWVREAGSKSIVRTGRERIAAARPGRTKHRW